MACCDPIVICLFVFNSDISFVGFFGFQNSNPNLGIWFIIPKSVPPGAFPRYLSLISSSRPSCLASWAGGEEGSKERAEDYPGEERGLSIAVSLGVLLRRSEGPGSCEFLLVPWGYWFLRASSRRVK